MKTKKICLILLGIIFILTIFDKIFVEYVYLSPNVNTGVLPYISKTIAKIDSGIKYSINRSNKNGLNMSLLYENAFGSTFLKHNPIPNDLDYEVGIYLGKYNYNGHNSKEIAESVENKMAFFENEFNNYIYNQKDKSLISNSNLYKSVFLPEEKANPKISSIPYSIDKIFQNKSYMNKTIKLNSNEILLDNYKLLRVFSSNLKFDKNTTNFLRDISIVKSFSFEIENTKTKQCKYIKMVPDTLMLTGGNIGITRRIFLPMVFVDELSARYIDTFKLTKNDNTYVDIRLGNFFEVRGPLNFNLPVKKLKRILQCTDLMEQELDKNLKENIYQTVSKNLTNKDMRLMNDYYTALENLIILTQLKNTYAQADSLGKIKQLLVLMQNNLKELKKSKSVNENDINTLLRFQGEIMQQHEKIKNCQDLEKFNLQLNRGINLYAPNIANIFDDILQAKKELISYINEFDKIFINCGFHKIKLYRFEDETLGIIKDDFTKNLTLDELKEMASENNLPNAKYKLINTNQSPIGSNGYSRMVRYKQTMKEEENWKKLRQQLLKDKNNFKIKRKFISIF